MNDNIVDTTSLRSSAQLLRQRNESSSSSKTVRHLTLKTVRHLTLKTFNINNIQIYTISLGIVSFKYEYPIEQNHSRWASLQHQDDDITPYNQYFSITILT